MYIRFLRHGREEAHDERYEYDAYGNCSILEPNFAPDPDGKSDYDNPYLFTGRRFDILDNSFLKIYYYRARYYSPTIGRFLQVDPIGYADSMNLYEYCWNNPLNGIDPWGLCKVLTEDEETFKHIMDAMREKLKTDKWANKDTWNWKEIASIYGLWDTKFHTDKAYKSRLFEIGGVYGYGYEVNYYAMGMLMKHRWLMPWAAQSLVIGYKFFRWYQFGATPRTWHFFWRGYDEYHGAAPWVNTNIIRNSRRPMPCIIP